MCQWQKRLDPAYDTYGAGLGNYVYVNPYRMSAKVLRIFAHRPHSPAAHHRRRHDGRAAAIDANARAYARRVAAVARKEAASPAYVSTKCKTATTSRHSR
jgi:hypothetical protein